MKKLNPIGWFEIPVSDLDRAERFYQNVFRVTLARQPEQNGIIMSWFPMEQDAPGATGSLVLSNYYQAAGDRTGVVVYFTAPDLDEALLRVEAEGGSVLVPKKDIGEYGLIAWVKDTEGNTIALHAMKSEGPQAP